MRQTCSHSSRRRWPAFGWQNTFDTELVPLDL
jgi:hypothetical protein